MTTAPSLIRRVSLRRCTRLVRTAPAAAC